MVGGLTLSPSVKEDCLETEEKEESPHQQSMRMYHSRPCAKMKTNNKVQLRDLNHPTKSDTCTDTDKPI